MDDTDQHPASRRLRLSIGAAIVLVLLGAAITVLVATLGPHGSAETVIPGTGTSIVPSDAASPGTTGGGGPDPNPAGETAEGSGRAVLYVHILGEVTQPGLYQLFDGDRAVDAVAAAGGLTPAADQGQLNLARFLSDGEQIIVPAIGQVPPPAGGGAAAGPDGTVNINTADAAGLEELDGVGPALAARIVEWRDANGRFASVDDLLNVTGIGEKKLDAFRDSVVT